MSISDFYIDHGIGPYDDVCEVLRIEGQLPPHGSQNKSPSSISEFYINHGVAPDDDVCEVLRAQGELPPHGSVKKVDNNNNNKNKCHPIKKKKQQIKQKNTGTCKCSACKLVKPSADFSRTQRQKGSRARCKVCVNA